MFEFHPRGLQARMIYKMKYQGRSDIAVNMGRHAAKALLPAGFFEDVDVIVPIPITRMRRFQRGYNQSEMLARGISEITAIPIDTTSVVRHRFLRSQTRLSLEQRQKTLQKPFTWCLLQHCRGNMFSLWMTYLPQVPLSGLALGK